MTGQRRDSGVDLIKGICILLVVLCHTNGFKMLGPVAAVLCEAVFLNAFFAATGYVSFSRLGKFDFAVTRRKFLALFLPYVGYSVMTILWHVVLVYGLDCREVSDTYFGKQLLLRDALCMVSGIGIGTLWFLPVMFVSYTLLQAAVHFTRKGRSAVFFAAFWVLLILADGLQTLTVPGKGMAAELISKYLLMLERILRGTAFLLLGWMLRDLLNRFRWKVLWLIPVSALVLVCTWQLQWAPLLQASAVTVFVLVLIRLGAFPAVEKAAGPILYCGRHSLQIMAYHYLILWPVEKMWLIQLFGSEYNRWLFFAVNLSTTCLLIALLEKLPGRK